MLRLAQVGLLVPRRAMSAVAALREAWGGGAVDTATLKNMLDHDNHEMRDKFRQFMKDPVWTPRYNISLEDERELALLRLKKICDAGFISVLDFRNNPLRIFAAHELSAVVDPAMTTKMTVRSYFQSVFSFYCQNN